MRINIFGSNGMIGSDIQNLADDKFRYFSGNSKINYFSLLDLAGSKSIKNLNENDLVLFLNAMSKPSDCEYRKNECLNINYFQTVKVLQVLLDNGVKVLFASTDQVYGSSKTKFFCENSKTNPTNFYAYSKLLVEEKFNDYENFKVLRFSQCINGLDSFSKYCKSCIEENEAVEIFENFVRNIFSTDLIHDFLIQLLNKKVLFNSLPGIINFGGNFPVNRSKFSDFLIDFNFIKKEENKIFLPRIAIDVSLLEKIMKTSYNFNFIKWKNYIYE